MGLESKTVRPTTSEVAEFTESSARKQLELLRDTEALLRRKTVKALVPVLPRSIGTSLRQTSAVAEESLQALAKIDLNQISDRELQQARILIGLSFVGFGALFIVLLILYLYTLHPELTAVEQIRKYWHQYVWFVSLGVAGMFVVGREAMREQVRE